jgi:hypothetical protein
MKAFLCLLCLTPVTIILAIAPAASTFLQHILLATATSKEDAWATEMWWNWYGSWIFFGGPFGRWVCGAILGFRILKVNRIDTAYNLPGRVVEQPHLRIIAMAIPAMILSVFCLVRHATHQGNRHYTSIYNLFQALALMTIRSILQGTTTIETLMSSASRKSGSRQATFVCIPSHSLHRKVSSPDGRTFAGPVASVHSILPGERMYDLGRRVNWNMFMKTPFLQKPKVSR